MAEALSTSFQSFYSKYTRSENTENVPQDNSREIYIAPVNTTTTTTNNASKIQRSRLNPRKNFVIDIKNLCQPKESKWKTMKQKIFRPSTEQYCSICLPYVIRDNLKVESNLKNLLNIYNISSIKKSILGDFIDNLKFFYQLKSHEYKYIYNEVLEDESVIKAIEAAAHETLSINNIKTNEKYLSNEIKMQQKNTECILTIMSANVKNWVYKIVGWFTFRVISLLATSLVVQPRQIEKVRESEQSGLPVIYLPLHKSHMDYILLGLVLTMHNIKPPLVAAGENLRVFFFSKLLSFLGAFYIKRQIDTKKDQLYWSILSSYIKKSMKNGHHIEIFLEGARTRTGKCCVPKGGLLSIIVDAYREGVIEDAWIIPVSMNYDRILEGNFVREQLGKPKEKETFFTALITFINAIFSRYGVMRIDFNTPFRLQDLYKSIDKKTLLENQTLKENGLEIMSENIRYKYTVDGMAKHIVYDCWKSTTVMSTNIVCFLLLKKYRNGTTLEQLAIDVSIIRDKLSQANRDVGFSGSSKDVIKHALSLLSPKLVVYEKTDVGYFIKPIINVPSLIELTYYENNLLSHYLHQSIVALSLSKLVCPEFWDKSIHETTISRKKLMECVQFLTGLLQFDFVFIKPCDSLDNIVETVIRIFEEEEIIMMDLLLDEEKRSQRLAKYLDSDSDDDYEQTYVEYDTLYRVKANENSLNKIKFYRSILMPYLECMAECAGSFLILPNNSVIERDHIQTILDQMHTNLKEGILFYGESISVDTIKHSFLAFEKFNCLSINTKDNVKILNLVDNELNDLRPNMQYMSDYIEDFVQQIN